MSLSALRPLPTVIRYVPALTGLRAMAAYLVFLHHYNPATVGSIAHRLLDQGYVGVTVFFVLSGFLLYHRYAVLYTPGGSWPWRIYLQQRFARLMPLYLLLLVLTLFVQSMVAGRQPSGLLIWLNLTLLKGLVNGYKFSGLSQSWSLTVEWTFYILLPALIPALRRWGLLLLTISLWSIGLILWGTLGQLTEHGFFEPLPFVTFYTFFGRAFEFVLGMELARRWRAGQLPQIRFPLPSSLVIIGSCLIGQSWLSAGSQGTTVLFWSEFILYSLLLPLGVGLLFLSLLREASLLRLLLENPFVQALGRSSYAFYLIHLSPISRALLRIGVVTNIALLFGILILLAYCLHRWVEQPLYRWLAPHAHPANPSIP
ncbi:acyltransferase family protein [Spirosoma pomorum]